MKEAVIQTSNLRERSWLDSEEGNAVLSNFKSWWNNLSDFDKIYYRNLPENEKLIAAATIDFLQESSEELELSPQGKAEINRIQQTCADILIQKTIG